MKSWITCWFASLVAVLAANSPVHADDMQKYAAIEIGSIGTRVVVLEVGDSQTKSPQPRAVLQRDKPANAGKVERDTKELSQKGIDEVTGTVEEFIKEVISDKYKVPAANIKVAASSSVAKLTNKNDLAAAIKRATGFDTTFLSVEQETSLTVDGNGILRGVLTTPLFDVGGGNTKATAIKDGMQSGAFEIPYGARTFREAVKPGEAFAQRAEQFRKETVVPALQTQLQKNPDWLKAETIYLTGGSSWAFARIIKPGQSDKDFVELTVEDLAAYKKKIAERVSGFPNVDTQSIPNAAAKAKAETELSNVKNIFGSYESRVSGSELLQAFFDEVVKGRKVTVKFVADSNYSVSAALALPDDIRKTYRDSLTKAVTVAQNPEPEVETPPTPIPATVPAPTCCYPSVTVASPAQYTYDPVQQRRGLLSRIFSRCGCR